MPEATTFGEAGLLAWLYLVGIGLLWPLRERYGAFTFVAFAFPTGLAAYVLIAWLAITSPLPFTPLGVLIIASGAAISVFVGVTGQARSPIRSIDFLGVLLGFAAVVTVSGTEQVLNLTRVTPDSFRYVQVGGILAAEGDFAAVPNFLMFQRPTFLPLSYTLADILNEPYLSSMAPMIATSGLASLIGLSGHARSVLSVHRGWLIALSLVAVATVLLSNRGLYHFFYVNNHMAFAVYLMLAAGTLWLAACRPKCMLWIPVPLWMSVMVLSRDESVLVLALLIVPLFGSTAFRGWERWTITAPVLAVSWVWFGGILRARAGGLGIEGVVDGGVIMTVAITLFVVATLVPGLRRFRRWAGPGMLIALWAAVPAMIALKPDTMTNTMRAMAENVGGVGRWGTTWVLLPLAIIIVFALVRVPEEWFLTVPVVGFFPVLMAVSFFVGPYRVAVGSPFTRMLMHGLLVSLMYVVIAASSATASSASKDRAP